MKGGASTCDRGHPLVPTPATGDGWRCDGCDKKAGGASQSQPLARGATMHMCMDCDYGLCQDCWRPHEWTLPTLGRLPLESPARARPEDGVSRCSAIESCSMATAANEDVREGEPDPLHTLHLQGRWLPSSDAYPSMPAEVVVRGTGKSLRATYRGGVVLRVRGTPTGWSLRGDKNPWHLTEWGPAHLTWTGTGTTAGVTVRWTRATGGGGRGVSGSRGPSLADGVSRCSALEVHSTATAVCEGELESEAGNGPGASGADHGAPPLRSAPP